MSDNITSILNNSVVRNALKQSWEVSQPGPVGCHEEGGFIMRDSTGKLNVERWASGTQNAISVPLHSNCFRKGQEIVATFHTHPNVGSEFIQGPSETDKRAVRDDPNLKGTFYQGELVVSAQTIFHIAQTGQVSKITNTQNYFTDKGGMI